MNANVLDVFSKMLEKEIRRLAVEEGLYSTVLCYPSDEHMGTDTQLLGMYKNKETAIREGGRYLTDRIRDMEGKDDVSLGYLHQEESLVLYVEDGIPVSSAEDLSEYIVVQRVPPDVQLWVSGRHAGW